MQKFLPPVSRSAPLKTPQQQPKRRSADVSLHSAISCEAVPRKAEVGRKKRSRKGCTSVPEAEKIRIKQRHLNGESISKISRAEGRHWRTVNRIVHEPDVTAYIADLRARFYGALEQVLESAVDYAVNARDGGWLAYKMLEAAGVIPNAKTIRPMAPTTEDDESAIHKLAVGMMKGSIERHAFFGLPLMEEDMKEAKKICKEEGIEMPIVVEKEG